MSWDTMIPIRVTDNLHCQQQTGHELFMYTIRTQRGHMHKTKVDLSNMHVWRNDKIIILTKKRHWNVVLLFFWYSLFTFNVQISVRYETGRSSSN